jgi:dienelactone hydrolase
MKTLSIPIGDSFIEGTLFHPEELRGNSPGVLFIHGWGSSEETYRAGAQKLARLGAICFTITLRGHGETSHQRETVSRTDNLHDALTAFDRLLAEPGVDAQRLGVVGSSYGGYLATLLTGEREVRWLGLRAPALYKDEGFERPKRQLNQDPDLHAFRRRPVPPAENRALECGTRFQGDVLLVESEHDTVIPHQVIANYITAFQRVRSRTHYVIRDADHALSNPTHRPEYEEFLCRWFKARFEEPA